MSAMQIKWLQMWHRASWHRRWDSRASGVVHNKFTFVSASLGMMELHETLRSFSGKQSAVPLFNEAKLE